ncbi:unnamed protein product [Dovyalis caffra]|uniref:Uncharacterized protein n=1 Tax=Dovyalis caffra TaxID=77055 RepID=A0AAV1SJE1_9ROSI|nr:unnamed protein product [Dovyalis caffra]
MTGQLRSALKCLANGFVLQGLLLCFRSRCISNEGEFLLIMILGVLSHFFNFHDLAPLDSCYTLLLFSFRLTLQVMVDGCVPDKAIQSAVVVEFGIEERYGKLLSC